MSEKRIALNQGGAWRAVVVTAFVFATSLPQDAQAGVFVKANNTTALNLSGSWTNNAVPGSSDIAQWDSNCTVNGANLGGASSWAGIRIANPSQNSTIYDDSHVPLTLNSSGTAIDMSAATKDFVINCAVILATNQTWNVGTGRTLTVGGGGVGLYVGAISGGFSLNKAGAGALTLVHSNTFSGVMTVSAGTLNVAGANGRLGNTSGIAVSNGASLVIGDTGNALADRINDAATVTLSGGTLTLKGKNSTATTETIGTLTIGAGGQSTVNVTTGTAATATLTLTSITRSDTGGTVTFGGNTGTIATSQALSNNILSGWAVWGGTTFGQQGNAVTTNASGNLTYLTTFDKTYTATTNGINDWTSSQNIYFNPTGATLTATLSANLSANSLTFADTNCNPTLDLGGKTLTLTSGGIFYTYKGQGKGYTIQTGTLTAGSGTAPAELFITSANYNYAGHSTISAAISNNNGQAVSVVQHANPGSAFVNNVLSGNNGYSGGTYINIGYIFINNDYNLGAVDGTVYLNGGLLGIRSTTTLNANRNLVAAANATAIVDTYYAATKSAALVTTIAGKVTGAGNFSKIGTIPTLTLDTGPLAGTVILANTSNDWAGTTTVYGGILQVGDGTTTSGSIPDRAVALSGANTTLKFANPTAASFNSVISGSGDLIKTGAGTLTLSGVNTYTNGTTISGGTLAIASDASLGVAWDGSVSGATVTNIGVGKSYCAIGSTNWAFTFSAPSSGTTASGTNTASYVFDQGQLKYVAWLKGGSGYVAPPTAIVGGAGSGGGLQAYVKGLLTLDGGTLQTTDGITSSRAVLITANNGTIDTAGNNSIFSGVFNGPGGLTKTGTGTLLLNGTNTYSGATTVSSGVLGGTGIVSGIVTNLATITAADTNSMGTLTVSNLVMAANATYVWNYNNSTQDLITVNGTLTLPTVATVNVSQVTSGTLPNPAVLFTFTTGAGAAATNGRLGSWVITGARPGTQVSVLNGQVIMGLPRGTLISVY